ncbi:hsp70-binding protein 1-like [Sitophilus oryzae]|uniref:Hsp70-binding protein 1-like n=1 Tax=Sitophilus oryzae TaxID=7048 RepID=A0A6J2XWI7_SITOR|nr:hsp70-binding protein 1-like [Sitophilus oryzae]
MPGIEEKKVEIAGAICAPPEPSGESQRVRPQPRHSTNLQGLLRFCVEATQSEDAPAESHVLPLDEERRKWLEEAIKSMSVDIIGLLQKQIKVLQKVDSIKPEDDISEYEQAVDIILEQVDHIDIACDFHKIGGFMVLYPCLKSPHPKIRAAGCELLAELCQNNPYCQEVVLDNEFVPKLLNMIDKDEDTEVAVKALYAVSAIIRHSQEGFNQFIHYNGPVILLKALNRTDDRFIKKTTFLLSTLCDSQPDFKSRLVFLDYIPTLITLISRERQPSHEYVLALLAALVEENATALSECRNPRHNLQEVLQKYVANCGTKEECLEEIQHCKRILYLVFGCN